MDGFACAKVDASGRGAQVTGGLGDRIYAEAGWNADGVNRTPGPELSITNHQAMLTRGHE
jgi:hypothetical protein